MTCSKLIINRIGHCPSSSDNVYYPHSEQTWPAVFNAAFCFVHAEHNFIKPKLFNWLVHAVKNILESAMWNLTKPIKLLTFKN